MTEILFRDRHFHGTLGLDLAIGPVHCSVLEVSAVRDLEVSGTSARNALAELPERRIGIADYSGLHVEQVLLSQLPPSCRTLCQ